MKRRNVIMATEKMFETALRGKFRFPFRGLISTEDLYDLPVESLDSIFKELNSQIKRVKEESLLGSKITTGQRVRVED